MEKKIVGFGMEERSSKVFRLSLAEGLMSLRFIELIKGLIMSIICIIWPYPSTLEITRILVSQEQVIKLVDISQATSIELEVIYWIPFPSLLFPT